MHVHTASLPFRRPSASCWRRYVRPMKRGLLSSAGLADNTEEQASREKNFIRTTAMRVCMQLLCINLWLFSGLVDCSGTGAYVEPPTACCSRNKDRLFVFRAKRECSCWIHHGPASVYPSLLRCVFETNRLLLGELFLDAKLILWVLSQSPSL